MLNYSVVRRLLYAGLLTIIQPAALQAQRQDTTSARPLFHTTGSAFAVSVSDLKASTAWYVEKLGLAVTMRVPRNEATRAAVVVLQGGGLLVELVQHDDAVSDAPLRSGSQAGTALHGFFKVGFTIDNFDATIDALRARGLSFAYGPFPRRGDQAPNVIIRDNAGNMIQILGK